MPSRARSDSTDPRLSAPKAVKPSLELGQSRLGLAVFHCALAPTCAGQARKGFVQSALRRLEMARASVVGAVLTKYDHKAANYGYGYGDGYGYGYGASRQALSSTDARQTG